MTPKRKALSLIGKFNKYCDKYPDKVQNSKDAAVYCAEQVIGVLDSLDHEEQRFWENVIQEIKNA